jgi:hypothetical protein
MDWIRRIFVANREFLQLAFCPNFYGHSSVIRLLVEKTETEGRSQGNIPGKFPKYGTFREGDFSLPY